VFWPLAQRSSIVPIPDILQVPCCNSPHLVTSVPLELISEMSHAFSTHFLHAHFRPVSTHLTMNSLTNLVDFSQSTFWRKYPFHIADQNNTHSPLILHSRRRQHPLQPHLLELRRPQRIPQQNPHQARRRQRPLRLLRPRRYHLHPRYRPRCHLRARFTQPTYPPFALGFRSQRSRCSASVERECVGAE